MTVQEFLTIDPDTLTADQLAEVAEAMLCDLIPCEYCSSWVPRSHEWGYYKMGGVEICPVCQKHHETMLERLIERRRQPPWSNMRMIFFFWQVTSVGLGRILRRHLIRTAFEDYFECERLVKKWM
jgi:hypothetical protein